MCLIGVGAEICSTVALQEKGWRPLLYRKNMNTLSEFSAGFLTDLHRRKSFLVLGTMLVNVTVEINRHEQCDSHDPASIPNTFLI